MEQAKAGTFAPPFDAGIRNIVFTLIANGVESSSLVKMERITVSQNLLCVSRGYRQRGYRHDAAASENRLPVSELRRTWGIIDGVIHGPWWVMTFRPPDRRVLQTVSFR